MHAITFQLNLHISPLHELHVVKMALTVPDKITSWMDEVIEYKLVL